MDSQELGRQVFQRRKEKRLSQGEVAQRAGISRNYISLIERGEARNVSMNIINQLAIALEITPATLMGQGDILIPPSLRQFGLEESLSFETVDWLAQMPRRGHEPHTVEEWRALYDAIRGYIEVG